MAVSNAYMKVLFLTLRFKLVTFGLLFVILTSLILQHFRIIQLGTNNVGADGPQTGQKAPDFTLPDMKGNSWTLSRNAGRRITVVYFCGCSRCWTAARRISRLQSERRLHSVVAVVDLDPTSAHQFVTGVNIKGTVLIDTNSSVAATYGALFCPRFYIISKEGRIASKSEPALEGPALDTALNDLKNDAE